jgi:hypothetical protein
MAKPRRGGLKRSKVQEAPAARKPRPDIIHSSVYLPEPVYEALREAAFKERVKIPDIVVEGNIGMALKRRGYGSIEDLVSGKKR